MRSRWVSPDEFKDRALARIGLAAFVVHKALEVMADDGGVSTADVDRVKSELLFRFDALDMKAIETAIADLEKAGLLTLYHVGEDRFAELSRFDPLRVHQPSKFRHPRPPATGETEASRVDAGVQAEPEAARVAEAKGEAVRVAEDELPLDDGEPEQGCRRAAAGTRRSTPLRHLDSKTLRHLDSKSVHTRGEKAAAASTHPDFPRFWNLYPKRDGANSRTDSEGQFCRNVARSVDPEAMIAGARRYAEHEEAAGNTGTRFVMQARKFLGKGLFWEESWDIPEQVGRVAGRIERTVNHATPKFTSSNVVW